MDKQLLIELADYFNSKPMLNEAEEALLERITSVLNAE